MKVRLELIHKPNSQAFKAASPIQCQFNKQAAKKIILLPKSKL